MLAFAFLASVVAIGLVGWVADRMRDESDRERRRCAAAMRAELDRHVEGGVDLDVDERYWWNR